VPRRRLLIVAGATAVVFVILTVLVAVRVSPLMRADAAISSVALRVALEHPVWRACAVAVTTSGGPGVVTVAAVTAAVALFVAGRRRDAAFVAVTMLGSAGIRLLVLNSVARPRPADRLAPAAGFSFPSGHTTGSAAAALTALAVLWPLLRARVRRIVAVAVVVWAMSVGISRVALVVHWPTDVLGGWLLATTVVVAAIALLRRAERDLQPGAGQIHELDGRGRRGRREGGDQDEDAEQPPAAGFGGGIGEGPHPTHGNPAVDPQ